MATLLATNAHLRSGDGPALSRYATAWLAWQHAKASLAKLRIGTRREAIMHGRMCAAERTLQELEKSLGLVASHRARVLSVLARESASLPARTVVPMVDAVPEEALPPCPIGWGHQH